MISKNPYISYGVCWMYMSWYCTAWCTRVKVHIGLGMMQHLWPPCTSLCHCICHLWCFDNRFGIYITFIWPGFPLCSDEKILKHFPTLSKLKSSIFPTCIFLGSWRNMLTPTSFCHVEIVIKSINYRYFTRVLTSMITGNSMYFPTYFQAKAMKFHVNLALI